MAPFPSRRFGLRAAAVGLLLASTSVLGGVAHAEGPGYGGTADQLSVTWVETQPLAMAAEYMGDPPGVPPPGSSGGDPNVIDSSAAGPALDVSGVGFRSQSNVSVRVGGGPTEERRTDVSGSLRMKVPADISSQLQPGASVLAIGPSPSGTRRTLVGSIPPRPSGVGPADILPWLGLLVFSGAGVFVIVKRRKASAQSTAAAE